MCYEKLVNVNGFKRYMDLLYNIGEDGNKGIEVLPKMKTPCAE